MRAWQEACVSCRLGGIETKRRCRRRRICVGAARQSRYLQKFKSAQASSLSSRKNLQLSKCPKGLEPGSSRFISLEGAISRDPVTAADRRRRFRSLLMHSERPCRIASRLLGLLKDCETLIEMATEAVASRTSARQKYPEGTRADKRCGMTD